MKLINTLKLKTARKKDAFECVGHVDTFNLGSVSGWVKNKNHDAPLVIDLYINNNLIAENLSATAFRPDVKEAGFGNGYYGFAVNLGNHLDAHSGKAEVSIRLAKTDLIILSKIINFTEGKEDDDAATGLGNGHTLPNISVTHLEKKDPEYNIFLDKVTATAIWGWSISRVENNKVFSLNLLVDGVLFCQIKNNLQPRGDLAKIGLSDGTGGFFLNLNLENLAPGEHEITVMAPDGTSASQTIICGEKLDGSHEIVHKSGVGSQKSANLWMSVTPCALSIVIPVYNAADDLKICIDRLAAHTPDWVNILFINDASPDPNIVKILETTSAFENMHVLHNNENMGFTRTVNRGLVETGHDDVIILNSDARVTPGWIQGLRAAVLSRPRVATVTAMSDRAGAFSAPKIGNDNTLPAGVDEITYAKAFRRRSIGLYPAVPTGNGFCMYISRACMQEIGLLDVEAFPRGYGEENDFCMRAGRAGWLNLIDDRTYVFHDRSKSFGTAKTDLMKAGREIIDQRYPEYKTAISMYHDDPGITFARFRALQALEDCERGELEKTRILYVVSTRTGGTPQTNRDLMGAIDDAVDGWLLRCDSATLELSQLVDGEIVPVKHHSLAQRVNPISHRSNEYDAVVTEWLLGLDPDIAHIRHLGWHGLSLPQICRQLDIRTVFSFHDFYTLCPNVKLIDAEQNFCGGTCTRGEEDCHVELWPSDSLPKLRDNWVHIWRERFSEPLNQCDAYVTTSESARDRILEHFPLLADKRFSVIPHGRDFSEFNTIRQTPEPDERIRILVPGNINVAKGLNVIEALIAHDKAECLEFHILGDIDMSAHAPHPRIIRHGKYSRHEFASKAAKTRPHVGAIFSIWDETYCHTLTELWSVGLPAMVFDYPTVGGRVRESGAGWVLDHKDIPALYEKILDAVFDPEEMKEKTSAVDAWQRGYGRGNTTRIMGASYLQVYRRILRQDAPQLIKVGVVCPQDASLQEANASTQIRIWERTRNHINRELSYIRLHPASLLDLARRGEIDGAIIQRTAIPRPMIERLRHTLKKYRIPFIMELDDDLLDVPADKDPNGKYKDYAPFLKGLLKDASAVTVSTPQLQTKMSLVNSNVSLVPNLLSDRLWLEKPRVREEDGTIRALYMGTNTHIEDLKMVLPALAQVAAQYPMFRLSLIGITAGYTEQLPDFVDVVDIPQESKSYRKFVSWLREQAANADFGIAPLAETEFNSSKSSLKILEYGALGLPVLASDTIVYRELGKTAPQVKLVRNRVKDWSAALAAQVVKGQQNRQDGEELRAWVVKTAMLRHSLVAYDALVKEVVK